MQPFKVNNLEDSERAIRSYALGLFYGNDDPTVTFPVVYAEGDQDRDGAYSSPDILTVDRNLEVINAVSGE